MCILQQPHKTYCNSGPAGHRRMMSVGCPANIGWAAGRPPANKWNFKTQLHPQTTKPCSHRLPFSKQRTTLGKGILPRRVNSNKWGARGPPMPTTVRPSRPSHASTQIHQGQLCFASWATVCLPRCAHMFHHMHHPQVGPTSLPITDGVHLENTTKRIKGSMDTVIEEECQ